MDHLVRNAEIYRLISGARVDYGLDRELAFVLASAEMNGLMRPGAPYTEKLLALLEYPIDDVDFVLRLLYFSRNNKGLYFTRFAVEFGVDEKRFNHAIIFADFLVRPHERFSRGIPPGTANARSAVVRGYFIRLCISKPCICTGSEKLGYFDYKQELFFTISNRSLLSKKNIFNDSNPAVYYRLDSEGSLNGHKTASFLAITPVYMALEMEHTKILKIDFTTGPLVAKRVMKKTVRSKENGENMYIFLNDYDVVNGTLSVICTDSSKRQMYQVIRDEIVNGARELALKEHRHFRLEGNDLMAVIGPGMQVLQLQLEENESDSLAFIPTGGYALEDHQIKAISNRIRTISKDASFSFREEDKGVRALVAFLPSTEVALAVREQFAFEKKGYLVKPHSIEKSDFYGQRRPKPIVITGSGDASNLRSITKCAICLVTPDHDDFMRLGLCGHAFCGSCLLHCLKSAEKFPIECVVVDCDGSMVFSDVDAVIGRQNFSTEQELNDFLEPIVARSVDYFLRATSRGYKRCMSENCNSILNIPAIFRKNRMERPPGEHGLSTDQIHFLLRTPIHCNGCSTARCGLCGFSFHNGVDCQEYYAKNYVYNNTELATWKKTDPDKRRFCPNYECHVLMEKIEGCNHIQCSMCRTHFCWICADFRALNPHDIYQHMQQIHGGNGLMQEYIIGDFVIDE